jgi:RNA polymerase sigma factor (sigma-70 family)
MNPGEKQPPGSVTLLLLGLCNVDEVKTKQFWDLFFPRLVRVANKILRSHEDAEDAAQEALVKFWAKATKEKASPEMHRYELWGFLSKVTVRQALDFLKHRSRKKRGGGKVYNESDLGAILGQDAWDMDCLIGELSFHTFDMVIEELLGVLSEQTQSILVWKMMGFTQEEIAKNLGCSERHVRRTMQRIRDELRNAGL